MTPTVKSLGIDRFTREERLSLVQEIWETIAAERPTPPLSVELREELDRRIAEDDANPDDVIPGEQVKREVRELLR